MLFFSQHICKDFWKQQKEQSFWVTFSTLWEVKKQISDVLCNFSYVPNDTDVWKGLFL